MNLVWRQYRKGGSEKLALLALADWCDDDGGNLYPAVATVAKKICVSVSQARRILHAFIQDGLLDVVLIQASGPFKALLAAWEVFRYPGSGDHPGGRVVRARAREVQIETSEPQPVEFDGDVASVTPFTASVLPRAISVIVPLAHR